MRDIIFHPCVAESLAGSPFLRHTGRCCQQSMLWPSFQASLDPYVSNDQGDFSPGFCTAMTCTYLTHTTMAICSWVPAGARKKRLQSSGNCVHCYPSCHHNRTGLRSLRFSCWDSLLFCDMTFCPLSCTSQVGNHIFEPLNSPVLSPVICFIWKCLEGLFCCENTVINLGFKAVRI